MTNEIGTKSETIEDGDKVATETETKTDTETKEPREGKQRSVSFNRDVHVKRFGKPRELRGTSSDPPSIRKEPFTHLTEKQLIEEANKVLEQAKSVSCTTDHSPEKFYSLPHRKKLKEDKTRRNSDDEITPEGKKKPLIERSTSDVTSRKKKERTSLSTLFRRGQRTKSPDTAPVLVRTQPVKRSKSDVSDLKSKPNLNIQSKPTRKRSGSESEEFLKLLRNKKTQLSPIIENSPRDDYFQKTSPLDIFDNLKQSVNDSKDTNKTRETNLIKTSKVVNPVEKPPRFKTSEKSEPKAPLRSKKGKFSDKDKSPPQTETPKSKTLKKKVTDIGIDEIDSTSVPEKSVEIKDKIKESIRKIEENVYGNQGMIHSSQLPPEKPPLTRGHTVDHIVKILKEDKNSAVPAHLISPSTGTNNINQPFSYTRPSNSPDPNFFVRNTSPERIPSPVNRMDRGVVYAQVIRDREKPNHIEPTNFKKYSPTNEKYGNFSDEDEGLGYEDRYKYKNNYKYHSDFKNNVHENYNNIEGYKTTDSPIRPKFREYKLTGFKDLEPTYANEYPITKDIHSQDYIDTFRGRADGMDTKRKPFEVDNSKVDLDFNELSHRRQLLESRLNARKIERVRNVEPQGTVTRYITETDPIYEANKRMKATEKYVNETAKYYRHTLEKDGYTESIVTEDYNKYDSDNQNKKYNTESRIFQKVSQGDRRDYIDPLYKPQFTEERKHFPPEPEYEPPSLEFTAGKPILSPDEYQEKKYKLKKHLTSSHDILQTGQKYKVKDDYFGRRKGHYASNPEIAQEREEDYANLRYLARHAESYHNSLRRNKSKDRHYKEDFGIRRHDSGDSRDYYRENISPRRYDIDNRLVDSGIENDFRKGSSGEIHRTRHRRDYSDEDVRDTSLFLDSERKHTEDNYLSEQIYANGDYLARFEDFRHDDRKEYIPREKSEDGSHLHTKGARYTKSPSNRDDKVNAKPPKAKKLSGLEKVKQLFSRDSSKKSKKEKEIVQSKPSTRVLKSPEHLDKDDPEYRRYTDPEPSDIEIKKKTYDSRAIADERRHKSSREELDRHDQRPRSPDPRDSDIGRKYINYDDRYVRETREERRYYNDEKRRYNSSDRESDLHRVSDLESDLRRTRSRTTGPMDSPALADRYRGRRRLATPSPTPSPPRRQPTPATQTSGSWFKSLDRIGRKREKTKKTEEKESIITTEDESVRKTYKTKKPLNSPAKNLRFFGDTDPDSDTTVKQTKTKTHGTLRKTLSNSSSGVDVIDHDVTNISYIKKEKSGSPRTKQQYNRNLHNISEIQSGSELESQIDRKMVLKPPISPYDRRSRSQSSSQILKASKSDLRNHGRNEDRGSSSELRSSQREINRDTKPRRRTPATNSGESSTEGDSSHQSQRSVVFLHATTVGDIPDPGRMSRNRSRDDVSSINSSNLQIRTTTKSFSLFAPWTPKHYNEQHDVHYSQRPRKTKSKERVFKKSSSTKNLTDDRPSTLQKNKSYSQTTLTRRPQNNRLTSSSTTLYRKPEKRGENNINATLSRRTVGREGKLSQSNNVLNRSDSERVSRSISMPKDNNKKAGWFKISNKNKKQEINTRVR